MPGVPGPICCTRRGRRALVIGLVCGRGRSSLRGCSLIRSQFGGAMNGLALVALREFLPRGMKALRVAGTSGTSI